MNKDFFGTLSRRYSDAYIIAGFYTKLGRLVKVIGALIGALIGLLIIVVFVENSAAKDTIIVALPLGVIVAAAIAGIAFVMGVLVSGVGQHLKATLDTAVNSSPHISDAEKAEIMNLSAQSSLSSSPTSTRDTAAVSCRACGKELTFGEKYGAKENLCFQCERVST